MFYCRPHARYFILHTFQFRPRICFYSRPQIFVISDRLCLVYSRPHQFYFRPHKFDFRPHTCYFRLHTFVFQTAYFLLLQTAYILFQTAYMIFLDRTTFMSELLNVILGRTKSWFGPYKFYFHRKKS